MKVNVKKEATSSLTSLNFLEALFLLFLGLKLGNVIDWSWWWVFAPIWIPIALVVVLIGIMAIGLMLGALLGRGKEQEEKK